MTNHCYNILILSHNRAIINKLQQQIELSIESNIRLDPLIQIILDYLLASYNQVWDYIKATKLELPGAIEMMDFRRSIDIKLDDNYFNTEQYLLFDFTRVIVPRVEDENDGEWYDEYWGINGQPWHTQYHKDNCILFTTA